MTDRTFNAKAVLDTTGTGTGKAHQVDQAYDLPEIRAGIHLEAEDDLISEEVKTLEKERLDSLPERK